MAALRRRRCAALSRHPRTALRFMRSVAGAVLVQTMNQREFVAHLNIDDGCE